MADTPAAQPKSKSTFGFLTRKIGPVPIWLIGLGLAGGYYWYTHYGPGAQKTAAAAQPKAQRPQVVVVNKGGGGKDGGRKGGKAAAAAPAAAAPAAQAGVRTEPGPTGRAGNRPTIRRPPQPIRLPPAFAGAPPPSGPTEPPTVTAAAPMTAGDVYGSIPTASPGGGTYDSGYPSDADLRGQYVPAG